MNDLNLTLIYYTANRLSDYFIHSVMSCLHGVREAIEHHDDFLEGESLEWEELPLVCVSQRPVSAAYLPAATFVCVGEIGASIYNVYRQILIGAQAAITHYVAMAEDDSLYTEEHYRFRPPRDDTFYYNRNRWVITRRLSADGNRREAFYYFRERTQMAQCICSRDLLVETLEEKFAKFPEPVPDLLAYKAGWGEPGRYEKNLKLTLRKREYFETTLPNITFNHSESLRGRRRVNPDDIIRRELDPWGNADDLWKRIVG